MAAVRAASLERISTAKANALVSGEFVLSENPPPTASQIQNSADPLDAFISPIVRIFIADTHEIYRIGIISALRKIRKWKVVGGAEDGQEISSLVAATAPDIVIADCSLPQGVETIRRIYATFPKIEILALATYNNGELLKNIMQAGARALVLKSDGKKHLIDAIECLAAHKPYLVRNPSETSLDQASLAPCRAPSVLSSCERNVVRLIAEGYSNKESSGILHRSQKTIETHRASAMRKLGLDSTAGLVRYAVRAGLVEA